MSPSLAAAIVRAKDHAGAKGHRVVTLEHLLLALADDEEAALVLTSCSVDLASLRDDVAAYLGRLEREPPGAPMQPVIAPELKRIIDYAAAAAQQGRRAQVDGAIVLAAMVGEGRSAAAGFLRAQELTFDAVVLALQRQAQERAVAAQQNGSAPPSAEDILANARERIAASRGQGGRVPRPAAQRGPEPEPENRRPGAPRQDAGLGDRAQPPPPVFAERPSDLPSGVLVRPAAARNAAATSAESSDLASSHSPPPHDAGATAATETEGSEQLPARAPPPLPLPQQQEEMAADPPPRLDAEPSTGGDQPPLPDWMKARQVSPGRGPAGGPPPPPPPGRDGPAPVRQPSRSLRSALDGVPRQLAEDTADPGHRPPPTLDAPSRRAAAAPARPPPRPGQAPAVEAGQLVENIPRRMRVGVTETVEVRVGRTGADLTGNLQGNGTPTRHDVYITKAMSVRLRAPDGGFRIDPASPETQWTESTMGPLSSDFAVWRFSITPNRRGEAVLQLVVAARVLARDGIMAETVLPEHVITVRVRTNYVRATMRASAWLAALAAGGVVGRMGEDALALALRFLGSIGAPS